MRDEIVEILVEEPSMKSVLIEILPKILHSGYRLNENCFIRSHQGKQDLRRSIPIKVRAYKHFSKPVKIIILHDQDSADCKKLKSELQELATQDSPLPSLIRIACRELESWYLGDMDAVERVYPVFKANKYRNWSIFRNPDNCNASYEIKRLIPNFQKGIASKEISKHLNLSKNNSSSFNHFVSGIKRFLN